MNLIDSKKSLKILMFSLLTSCFLFSNTAYSKELISGKGLNVGEKIPTFDLENESHNIMKFNENFRGKALLLVVSNYCTKDMAGAWTIGTFYKYHKNKNFTYPTIFSRRCVPFYVPNAFVSQSAKSTAEQTRIPYFLMDWNEEIAMKFKASKENAHIYVVDKKGTIRYKMELTTPLVSREEMESTLEKVLKE